MITEYNDGISIIEAATSTKGIFKISPSSLSEFFTDTNNWYREKLMGEQGFNGSSATVLGSCVHHFAELAGEGKPIPGDAEYLVEEYLTQMDLTVPDLDKDLVRSLWRDMSTTLIEGCVTPTGTSSSEEFIYHKLLPNIFVGGTYDRLELLRGEVRHYVETDSLVPWKQVDKATYLENKELGNKVKEDFSDCTWKLVDFKTASRKPKGWSWKYRLQMLTYAYILYKQKGIVVTEIALEFVVRPTKTLPCRHFNFTAQVDLEDMDMVEGILKLVAESVQMWNAQPELRYLLAQDFRLKLKEPTKLFK